MYKYVVSIPLYVLRLHEYISLKIGSIFVFQINCSHFYKFLKTLQCVLYLYYPFSTPQWSIPPLPQIPKLVLLIYSWMCGLLMEHGWLTRGISLNLDYPCSSKLSTVPELGSGASCTHSIFLMELFICL